MKIIIEIPDDKDDFAQRIIQEIFCIKSFHRVEQLYHDFPGIREKIRNVVYGFKSFYMEFGNRRDRHQWHEWFRDTPELIDHIYDYAKKYVSDLYNDPEYFDEEHG